MNPTLIMAVIIGLAVLGSTGALIALRQVRREEASLDRLEAAVNTPEEWVKVYQQGARDWLRATGLPLDSHAADLLVAVRGGWAGGILPVLGDLHALIARRERARPAVRLAGGIAASLLICGIVGTLLGIHPLLTDFHISTAADGTVQEASASARDLMALVGGLGKAFQPSLAALAGTLVVVFARGLYVHHAHKLIRRLDLFVADVLMPSFRLPTQDEVMAGIKDTMASLTRRIEERDQHFGKTIHKLDDIISRLEERTPALEGVIAAAAAASEKLAGSTNSVTVALDRNFGPESPSAASLELISELSAKVSGSFGELSSTSSTLNRNLTTVFRKIASSSDRIEASAKKMPDELREAAGIAVAESLAGSEKARNALDASQKGFETAIRNHINYFDASVGGQRDMLSVSAAEASAKLGHGLDQAAATLTEHVSEIATIHYSASEQIVRKMDDSLEKIETLLVRMEALPPVTHPGSIPPPLPNLAFHDPR